MQTEEFKIHSPKQLREVPQEKITEFIVESRDPAVRVQIGAGIHQLATFDDSPEVQELAEEIMAVFQRRKSKARLWLGFSPILLLGVLTIGLVITTQFFGGRNEVSTAIANATIALFFLYVVVLPLLSHDSKSVVIPMYKKEVPKAWYVSDTLKISLLVAVVTAILSIVGTLLFVDNRP